jgi:hypothetical protein
LIFFFTIIEKQICVFVRFKFLQVANQPEEMAELQLKNYLKASEMNQELNQVI